MSSSTMSAVICSISSSLLICSANRWSITEPLSLSRIATGSRFVTAPCTAEEEEEEETAEPCATLRKRLKLTGAGPAEEEEEK